MCPRVDGWFEVPFKSDTKEGIEDSSKRSWTGVRRGQLQVSGKSITHTIKLPEKSTSLPSGTEFILIWAKQCAAWYSAETETPSFFVSAMIAAVSDSEAVMV